MASTRLFRMSRPLGPGPSCDFSSNSTCSSMVSSSMVPMCLRKAGLSSKNFPAGGDERKAAAAAGGSGCEVVVLASKMEEGVVDLGLLVGNASDVILQWWTKITKEKPWKFNIQVFIEKAIVDCRFFTLFAIGGSLLGSVICFFEGCSLILKSYLQYFGAISRASSQQGRVVQLLIEAIDVFLVGTAMLIFGMSMFVMFVGTKNLENTGSQLLLRPSLFGNFNIKRISSRVGIQSVMQAKSKMGHAVIMILLVEVLEKFKSIPVVTGLDLACFSAAIFVSSASIFLLSRLAVAGSGTSIQ